MKVFGVGIVTLIVILVIGYFVGSHYPTKIPFIGKSASQ